ncbi:hypothetical protein BDW_03020 [Bdellovibrio bacteriovorus W]|nr:hypothetical protein BDW_03020 [Bdellovibrio bacteriovorus W]
MQDDNLKKLLKSSVKRVPEDSPYSATVIWNKIESQKRRQRSFFWGLPVAFAVLCLVVMMNSQKVTPLETDEENFLYSEWSELMQDSDLESDLNLLSFR